MCFKMRLKYLLGILFSEYSLRLGVYYFVISVTHWEGSETDKLVVGRLVVGRNAKNAVSWAKMLSVEQKCCQLSRNAVSWDKNDVSWEEILSVEQKCCQLSRNAVSWTKLFPLSEIRRKIN